MSIASELSRIQSAKSALKTSINAKTDSQHQITNETIDNYSSFVDSITGGGGTGGVYEVNSVQEMEALTGVSENDYCVVKGRVSILPVEYTEVEYIQSSGTQFIDTGVKPYKTKTEIKFSAPTTPNNATFVAGAGSTNTSPVKRYYVLQYKDNSFYSYSTSGTSITLGTYNGNPHTIIYNDSQNKVYFDNVEKGTISDLSSALNYNMYLFGYNYNGGFYDSMSSRIYYCKITDKNNNNTLIRNMIPCYRNSDNVIGMYDTVNNVFYTNSGSGTFTKGSDIENSLYKLYQYRNSAWVQVGEEYLYPTTTVTPTTTTQLVPIPTGYMGLKNVYVNGVEHTGAYKVDSVAEMNAITDMETGDYCVVEGSSNVPSGYTEVTYIQSSGTQCIDTGVYPTGDTRTIFDFEIIDYYSAWLFGSRNGSGTDGGKYCVLFNREDNIDKLRSDYNTTDGTKYQITRTRHVVDKNKNITYLDNTLFESKTYASFTGTCTMALFSRKSDNNYYDTSSAIKLYSCKIYNNNTLIRNFVPCYRNSDSIIGLYDTVNNGFYTNLGTGTFTKGADVQSLQLYQYNGTSWVEV